MYPPYSFTPYCGHRFSEVSQAVPDQSYSVKDLLRRFTTGTAPAVAKQSFYEENPDIDNPLPTLNELDLAELQELTYNARNNVNTLRDKYNHQIQSYYEQKQRNQQQQPNQQQQENE